MMTRAAENQPDVTAIAMALAAQAVQLETRVKELRQELADLGERMTAVADALHRLPRSEALPQTAAGEEA
jgi:hypothetical protein